MKTLELMNRYHSCNGGHSLANSIELKKPKGGSTSKQQEDMISMLDSQGYHAVVAHGWIQAKTSIECYLRDGILGRETSVKSR